MPTALKLAPNGTLALREADVTRQILDYLHAHGWRCLRMQSGLFQRPNGGKARVRIGEAGLPDYIVMRGNPAVRTCPQMFFLELKRPGGKPSAAQMEWRRQAEADGFAVCCADSVEYIAGWIRRN
jgi:hypothetical protein